MNRAECIAVLFAQCGKSVHIEEKVPRRFLSRLFPKLFAKTISHGWLLIKERDDHWLVTFTTDMAALKRKEVGAFCVAFRKRDGTRVTHPGFTGAWEIAHKAYAVTDEGEAQKIERLVSRKIIAAYEILCDVFDEEPDKKLRKK